MTTPPPPPGAGQLDQTDRIEVALFELEKRLAKIEEHSRVSRTYLGWMVFFFIVLPVVMGVGIGFAIADGPGGPTF
jgi:hypothetical protein